MRLNKEIFTIQQRGRNINYVRECVREGKGKSKH